MKVALLADIHGNYVALEECLNYINGNNFDMLVFLGDYITDCPYPQKTLNLLKQISLAYPTRFVRGNREDYMLRCAAGNETWQYNSTTGNLLSTYEQLNGDDIEWFAKMPIADTVKLAGCDPFDICHGTPNNNRKGMGVDTTDDNFVLENIASNYLFCGHIHAPIVYEHAGKKLICCSSVGMPTNNQTCSQFTQIEFISGRWEIKLISLKYNIEQLLTDFKKSNAYNKYKYWAILCSYTLTTGINYPLQGLIMANEIAKEKGEELSELHWAAAAKKLNIESII